jgi:general secretion pathway protein D
VKQKPFLLTLFVLLYMAVITVWAAPYPVQIQINESKTAFTIRAEKPLRYYVDYSTRTLMMPEAQVAKDSGVPEWTKLEVRENLVTFTMQEDFTLALSPDAKLLTVTKGAISEVSSLSSSDVRAPILVYLSYADPAQVAALLQRLYPGVRVELDTRQRALILLVSEADRPVLLEAIKLLDAPRPQVTFEAEILEINRNYTQQLGIDYTKLVNLNFRLFEPTVPAGIIAPQALSRAPISLEVGINLLKSTGAAKTLARPRVTTLDGLEARINATQNQPIRTIGQGGSVTVSNITTGISMRLQPRVAPDQTIESNLSISVSSPTGFTPEGLPSYASREVGTTVRVRNGESIVIGGLLESRSSQSRSGIPGLMDLPIIGELFQTTLNEERETDLLIIVTPYIIAPPQATPSPISPKPAPIAPVLPANPEPTTPPITPTEPPMPIAPPTPRPPAAPLIDPNQP